MTSAGKLGLTKVSHDADATRVADQEREGYTWVYTAVIFDDEGCTNVISDLTVEQLRPSRPLAESSYASRGQML